MGMSIMTSSCFNAILTGEEHEGCRCGEVGRRGPPASDDAGGEGDEHEEKGDDEEGNHGAAHV